MTVTGTEVSNSDSWEPSSWRAHEAQQQPNWPDPGAYDAVIKSLAAEPPLVHPSEITSLTRQLAHVAAGDAFLLQGGDCAETFAAFHADGVRDKLKVLLQMAVVLTYGAQKPVVKVGRIAGQFAKPRSSDMETRDGVTLPSYRGDAANELAFTEEGRIPNPARLQRMHVQSQATLNLLKSMTRGGFADLERVQEWNRAFVAASPLGQRYAGIAAEIDRALKFLQACGIDMSDPELHQVDFWTSHEALILGYEEAFTRLDRATGKWFDTSAHMLWIGNRTRQLDGAHLHFAAGVANPIGVKVGPGMATSEVDAICEQLNPDNTPGRVTLISRYGAKSIDDEFPALVAHVRDAGHAVVWSCDPMHGNTFTAESGYKTRHFDDVMAEVRSFFGIHRQEGTVPGGIHMELTGENVTECLGGAHDIADADLDGRYETACDPRLNNEQALELAFELAEQLKTA